MNDFEQACIEIAEEINKNNPKTQHELNQLKLKVLNKYKANGLAQIPKNADIYFAASEKEREKFKELLSLKPVRTISGVSPIALMSEPYPCPHTMKGIGPCTYCPGGPDSAFGNVPQSYTGKEPSTRRSIRNNYDPYLIVFNRLEHYVAMGKVPDKAELIIQGGTFTFFPKAYQEYFVKYALKAMNDFSRLFFSNDAELDMAKFKNFFELPRLVLGEDERTQKVHKKLLHMKNIDLSDLEARKNADSLFFNSKFSNGHFDDGKVLNAPSKMGNNKQNQINLPEHGNKLSVIENQINDANILAIKNVQNKLKAEDNSSLALKQVQKENETALIRCVGLTIETKSDFGKLYHGNLMLELGCTRVELGIQSIYDDVLEATNRGNTVADNIESIRILKDLGFKINAHYMPGLPLTTKEMDLKGLKTLFENPDYKPDMLKLYPCMVMEGTKLYEDWKNGTFNPLTTKEAAEIIAEAKKYVPKWCRIMRVQRDIPTFATASGVDRTNLRQYVEKICADRGIKCRCIRCREAGFHSGANFNNIQTTITEYEASHGKELFIAAEDVKNDVLFGFCRMRFSSQFLRKEITQSSALIRELHVFSAAAQIGKKTEDSFQHRGIGKNLLLKAEEIARQNGKDKMVIISGIGAREYFRKFGYKLENVYMSKILDIFEHAQKPLENLR
ncbi:tRNA uridine(34) 5-carboxymethylaminomethyl modification radical SAM/GNAT enzyme Elp3 [Candidatus Woesearchaeota archaeon]|nr:tRNA uridine(34) 5-carboxymethylaminomethyl modification radical SAM/GNAT enzyme Elp3 [Candidatus Woesearchaeota archaeon]